MEVKDALTLMNGFGALLIALLSLIVAIIAAINQKKLTAPAKVCGLFLTVLPKPNAFKSGLLCRGVVLQYGSFFSFIIHFQFIHAILGSKQKSQPINRLRCFISMVEHSGIEPLTSTLPV